MRILHSFTGQLLSSKYRSSINLMREYSDETHTCKELYFVKSCNLVGRQIERKNNIKVQLIYLMGMNLGCA